MPTPSNTTPADVDHGAHAVLESVITCPECGLSRLEVMPTNCCQFFYECVGCKRVLKPAAGHCCVFCSYGTVKCPSMQVQGGCCA
ncbi:GDCCVxC domain-containing (seleno)protein [Panacagrimonas sp.]|uniref:GDCCVxC domain-containing (seleno)protein n=1 Tax=Panacagrimonas sp. TaxID=2480088 RepID=UPI003B522322